MPEESGLASTPHFRRISVDCGLETCKPDVAYDKEPTIIDEKSLWVLIASTPLARIVRRVVRFDATIDQLPDYPSSAHRVVTVPIHVS